jgi:hypothetical protein
MNPIFFNTDLNAWCFYDETWTDFHGPFKSKWEAEKMLSLYAFDILGLGDNETLYLNRQKTFELSKLK